MYHVGKSQVIYKSIISYKESSSTPERWGTLGDIRPWGDCKLSTTSGDSKSSILFFWRGGDKQQGLLKFLKFNFSAENTFFRVI